MAKEENKKKTNKKKTETTKKETRPKTKKTTQTNKTNKETTKKKINNKKKSGAKKPTETKKPEDTKKKDQEVKQIPKKEEVKEDNKPKKDIKKEDVKKKEPILEEDDLEKDKGFLILVAILSIIILIISLWSFIKSRKDFEKNGHKKVAIAFCQAYEDKNASKLEKYILDSKMESRIESDIKSFKEADDRFKNSGAVVETECEYEDGKKLDDEAIKRILKDVKAEDLGEVKNAYEYEFDLDIFLRSKNKDKNKEPTLEYETKIIVAHLKDGWKVLEVDGWNFG